MRGWIAVLATCALGSGQASRADVWDVGAHDDNAAANTHNELLHGMEQIHDLAAQGGGTVADVDWYRLQVPQNSSFEVVLDGVSGAMSDGADAPVLQLVEASSMHAVQTAAPVTEFGVARRLRYTLAGPVGEVPYFVRVQGAACGLACTPGDQYRLRYYDTTLRLPRFNNTNGQVTILIVQNPTRWRAIMIGYAFGAAGESVGTIPITLEPYEVLTANLTTVAAGQLANKVGGILFLNTAGYGELAGKSVVMDPSTGFVFETPLTYRPY